MVRSKKGVRKKGPHEEDLQVRFSLACPVLCCTQITFKHLQCKLCHNLNFLPTCLFHVLCFSIFLKAPLSHLHGHQTMLQNMLNFPHCRHLLPVSMIQWTAWHETSMHNSNQVVFVCDSRQTMFLLAILFWLLLLQCHLFLLQYTSYKKYNKGKLQYFSIDWIHVGPAPWLQGFVLKMPGGWNKLCAWFDKASHLAVVASLWTMRN